MDASKDYSKFTVVPEILQVPTAPTWAEAPTYVRLYDAGLNVFPIRPGSKAPFDAWAILKTTRLHPDALHRAFAPLATGELPNLAIVTGHTSGDLFCLDCEDEKTFLGQIRQFRRRHLPVWALRSGGAKRGGHILVRCAEGTVKHVTADAVAAAAPELGTLEVLSNGAYFVGPGSLHPDGGRYTFHITDGDEPPTIHLADLDWLPLEVISGRCAGRPMTAKSALAAKTLDFLQNGAPPRTRNARLYAAAKDIHGNECEGVPLDYDGPRGLWARLEAAARNCDRTYDPFTDAEITSTIASARSKPCQPAKWAGRAHRKKSTAAPVWQRARAWALSQHWPGKAGTTDRAVFLAHCERAKFGDRTGAGCWRASVDELSELAGFSPNAVIAANRRLVAAGHLARVGVDRLSAAALYAFPPAAACCQICTPTSLGKVGVQIRQNSDAAERGALGKTAWVLYAALLDADGPLTTRQAADLAHLSYRQTRRALLKLESYVDDCGYRMVEQTARGAWVAFEVTDDWLRFIVTDPAGTTGAGERRKAKNRAERQHRAASWVMDCRRRWEYAALTESSTLASRIPAHPDTNSAATAQDQPAQAQTAPVVAPDLIPAHPDNNSAAPALPILTARIGQYGLEDDLARLRGRTRRTAPNAQEART